MTDDERTKCHTIIHSHAVAAAGGNAVPVPGLGVAVDIVTMTTMCMALSVVFGGNVPENVAKGMAIAAIKSTMLKQPIKMITKEAAKLIPFLGSVIAPAISVVILESAGWVLANELDEKRK